MKTIQAFHSITDVQNYVALGNPDLKADFYLSVIIPEGSLVRSSGIGKLYNLLTGLSIPIINFSIPEFDMNFSASEDLWYHPTPSVSAGSMTFRAIKAANDLNFLPELLWSAQFTESGALRYEYFSSMPSIDIGRYSDNKILYKFTNCRFTKPIPEVDKASSDITVYTCTVTYESIVSF